MHSTIWKFVLCSDCRILSRLNSKNIEFPSRWNFHKNAFECILKITASDSRWGEKEKTFNISIGKALVQRAIDMPKLEENFESHWKRKHDSSIMLHSHSEISLFMTSVNKSTYQAVQSPLGKIWNFQLNSKIYLRSCNIFSKSLIHVF